MAIDEERLAEIRAEYAAMFDGEHARWMVRDLLAMLDAQTRRAEDAERKLAALRDAVSGEVDDMSEHAADGECAGPTGAGRRGACPTCRTAERLRAALAARSPPPHARPRDGWEDARAVMARLGYRMENDPALGVRWLPASPPPHAHPRDVPAVLAHEARGGYRRARGGVA